MLRGRIEHPVLSSALLEGNPLGDPTDREVLVYLPPGYDASKDQRYPLLMLLPSYAGGHRSFTNFRIWEPTIFERYERLLAAGEAPEAIVIAPDAMTRWGGSQLIDSPATGPYQRYLVEEVLPFVYGRYRTLADRAHRAVAGHSSGGFGALRLGLDRPSFFSVYGSHAGDCAFEVSVRPSFTSAAITLGLAGGPEAFVRRFEERGGPRGGGDFEAIMTIATAACYAPDMEAPLPHAQLPFDLATGLPIPSAWQRWLSHDPLVRAEADPSAFADAKLVFLDAGDRDEHGLQLGARLLAERLRARGVSVVHEEFEGTHRNTSFRWDRSLPLLLGAIRP